MQRAIKQSEASFSQAQESIMAKLKAQEDKTTLVSMVLYSSTEVLVISVLTFFAFRLEFGGRSILANSHIGINM